MWKKKKIFKEFSIARSFDAFQDTLRDTLWIKKKKNSSFKGIQKLNTLNTNEPISSWFWIKNKKFGK